jgi:IS4 transposase
MKMPNLKRFIKKFRSKSYDEFFDPLNSLIPEMPVQKSGSNKQIKFSAEDQLKSLIYFHMKGLDSGLHLLEELNNDNFAKSNIAPDGGLKKSTFFDALNERGLEQFSFIFDALKQIAISQSSTSYEEYGKLIAIDGSLIDSVLSMYWADYRANNKKAKAHVGFDLNKGIPHKIYLDHGNSAERPFVEKIIDPGDTSVLDRGYQSHEKFDQWAEEKRHFVCRIKATTTKEILHQNEVESSSLVFYDACCHLGTLANGNRTQIPLRLIASKVDGINYWIATDRFDLTAEQIAFIYKLRWNIESFFAWWKRHLKVYHLISRTKHGLMIQLLAGLITYLLISIYCESHYRERVSIKRVRQLRIDIRNESRMSRLDLLLTFIKRLIESFAIF